MSDECYFQPITGLNPDTLDQMVRSASNFYMNVDEAPLEDQASTDPYNETIANAIRGGAIQGGVSVSEENEEEDIEIDGVRGPTAGLQVMMSRVLTATVRPVEFGTEILRAAMTASDVTAVGNGLIKHQPRLCMSPKDYIANVLITARKGAGSWILWLLRNCRATDGMGNDFADDETTINEIQFRSHYDMVNPTQAPYTLYHFATVPTFLLTIDTTTPIVVEQSGTTDLTLNLSRVMNYAQEISNAVVVKAPEGVTGNAFTAIAGNANTGTLTIAAAANARLGKGYVHVNAVGADGKVSTTAVPITVVTASA
jgi:hypothetical protein